jgi:hypothetical protein
LGARLVEHPFKTSSGGVFAGCVLVTSGWRRCEASAQMMRTSMPMTMSAHINATNCTPSKIDKDGITPGSYTAALDPSVYPIALSR